MKIPAENKDKGEEEETRGLQLTVLVEVMGERVRVCI